MSGCLRRLLEGINKKGVEGTFQGVGNVLSLECGLGYLGVHICQNSSVGILQMRIAFHGSDTLIKVTGKKKSLFPEHWRLEEGDLNR